MERRVLVFFFAYTPEQSMLFMSDYIIMILVALHARTNIESVYKLVMSSSY